MSRMIRSPAVPPPAVPTAPMDPWERQAQAALVLRFLRQRLDPISFLVLQAYYTLPEDAFLRAAKTEAIDLVANHVRKQLNGLDPLLVHDICRGVCGLDRSRSNEEWADTVSRSPKTVKDYRGRVRSALSALRRRALDAAEAGMYENGWTSAPLDRDGTSVV